MGAPPHGTVTFLFTDIEGSTRWWDESPDGMRAALDAHDRIIRSVIEEHGGYVFSTAGDAFSAAFWTPAAAVEAAVESQRRLSAHSWPEPVVLRVRMGLHTGTADERGGDYFGPSVNRAARLMAAGHGGQILVSSATRELLLDRPGAGVKLEDLGEHELSGLSQKVRVFQLTATDLPSSFPPIRSPGRKAGNLPRPLTSFVGRTEDQPRLAAELAARRLVTLVGTGGVGKTRLALEAAWCVADSCPDGAWLVELAPASEPDAVAPVVADALRVTRQAGLSTVDSIVDALRGRRQLLVLDNAEHVLTAVADLVGRVLRSCDGVRMLVTSREPLGIDGEQVWPVPPLDPDLEGVELFGQRARAVGQPLVAYEADTVRALCRRLDGIPLAIELAAARARSMNPGELLTRLDDRFRFLRRTGRGGAERHRTLLAAVDWSYQLLSDEEQRLFDRLAVFAGTFDRGAAEQVCGGDSPGPWTIDEGLEALVDKSMVVAQPGPSETRYRLLETLRQYARDRLDARGELAELHDRHLRHYLAVSGHARADYEGTANAAGRARFGAEWDNLRAAVGWAVACGDSEAAGALVEASFWYAYWGLNHEHGDWAERARSLPGAAAPVHGITGMWAFIRGELRDGLRHGQDGLAMTDPDGPDAAICQMATAVAHWYLGDVGAAVAAVSRYRLLAETIGDPGVVSQASAMYANLVAGLDNGAAAESARRAQTIAAGLANPSFGAYAAVSCVSAAVGERRWEDASRWNEVAATLAGEGENRFVAGVVVMHAAVNASRFGRDPIPAHRDAVDRLYRARDWLDIWFVVDSLGLLWAAAGRVEAAAVLFGHLEANDIRYPARASRRAAAIAALENRADTADSFDRGARLDRHALVAYVLDRLAEEAGSGDHAPAAKLGDLAG